MKKITEKQAKYLDMSVYYAGSEKIEAELKQKVLDIIYWAEWDSRMRDDGYEERWMKHEDLIVQAIVAEVHSSTPTTKVKNE